MLLEEPLAVYYVYLYMILCYMSILYLFIIEPPSHNDDGIFVYFMWFSTGVFVVVNVSSKFCTPYLLVHGRNTEVCFLP